MSLRPISLRQMPLVFGGILLITGYVSAEYLPVTADQLFYLIFTGILLFILFKSPIKNKPVIHSIIIIIIFLLTAGAHSKYLQQRRVQSLLPREISDRPILFQGEIEHIVKKSSVISLTMSLLENTPLSFVCQRRHPVKISVRSPAHPSLTDLSPGDVILTELQLYPLNPSDNNELSDYEKYLWYSGISYTAQLLNNDIQKLDVASSKWKVFRYEIRNNLLDELQNAPLRNKTKALLKALLFGQKSDIDTHTLASFADSGTMHILAVSGLHVGIICSMLLFLSKRLFYKLSQFSLTHAVFIILGLFIFAELSGGAPPVWRAVLMTSIYFMGRSLSLSLQNLNLVGVIAVIILLSNPDTLYNLSFQLSFTAVIGIILIYPLITQHFKPKRKAVKYITDIIIIGFAAQLTLAPLSLYYFNQISLLSPLVSVFAILIAFFLISGGCLLLLFSKIHLQINEVIGNCLDWAVIFLEEIIQLTAQFHLLIVKDIYLNTFQVALLFSALILIITSLHQRTKKWAFYSTILLCIHGVYFSIIKAQHSLTFQTHLNHITQEIDELYIGRTAYYLNEQDIHKRYFRERRKKFQIKDIKVIEKNRNKIPFTR